MIVNNQYVHSPITNSSELHGRVQLGVTAETQVLEFKQDLDKFRAEEPRIRREGQKETCRDISALANHRGGCLLVGVKAERRGDSLVATSYVPLNDLDGRIEWILQAVQNYLSPSSILPSLLPISVDGGKVLAVNVPPALNLVSVWDRDERTAQFYRRTDYGKEAMNPDEAFRHAFTPSRAKKLAFLRAQQLVDKPYGPIELIGGVQYSAQSSAPGVGFVRLPVEGAEVRLQTIGEDEFQLVVTVAGASSRLVK